MLRQKQKQQWSKGKGYKGYKGYKDGLQPETLPDGNWLVKQNQPVSTFAQAEAEAAVGSDASFSTCFKCT